VSWSDTLIVCNLPDSGNGAGGNVIVQTTKGVNNKRALSIFSLGIDKLFWQLFEKPPGLTWYELAFGTRWIVSWRIDISPRLGSLATSIPFEISKNSYGGFVRGNGLVDLTEKFHWADTNTFTDSTYSLSGIINLKNNSIHFTFAKLRFQGGYSGDTIFYPTPTKFDSSGNIQNYSHSITVYDSSGMHAQIQDSLYKAEILFPPNPTSSVSQQSQPNANQISIFTNENSIILQSANPLGSTIASLYRIDGRLLKRMKFDISVPGIYMFDVSDLHARFTLLVLQTEKGVITKKISF